MLDRINEFRILPMKELGILSILTVNLPHSENGTAPYTGVYFLFSPIYYMVFPVP